jgi:hypothetical protein
MVSVCSNTDYACAKRTERSCAVFSVFVCFVILGINAPYVFTGDSSSDDYHDFLERMVSSSKEDYRIFREFLCR